MVLKQDFCCFVLFFCLVFFVQAEEFFGFSVSGQELQTGNLLFLDSKGQNFFPELEVHFHENRHCIRMTDLSAVFGLNFTKKFSENSTIGLRVNIFLPEKFSDTELILAYNSRFFHEDGTKRVFNTADIKKGQWSSFIIWLPGFTPGLSSVTGSSVPDIAFAGNNVLRWYFLKRKGEKPGFKFPVFMADQSRDYLLNNPYMTLNSLPDVFISSMELVTADYLSELELSEQVRELVKPEKWEWLLLGLALSFYAGIFIYALFGFRYHLLSRMFVLLFLATLPLLGFLASHLMSYLSILAEMRLEELRADLRKSFQTVVNLEEEIEKKLLSHFQAGVQKTAEMLAEKNWRTDGFSEEFLRVRQLGLDIYDEDEGVKELAARQIWKNFQPFAVDYVSEEEELRQFKQLEFRYFETDFVKRWYYLSEPVVRFLRSFASETGVTLMLTNGKEVYRPDNFGELNQVTGLLFRILASRILEELTSDPRQNHLRVQSALAFYGELRNLAEKTVQDMSFMEEYMNRPRQSRYFIIRSDKSFVNRELWDWLRIKDSVWLAKAEIDHRFAAHNLYKLLQDENYRKDFSDGTAVFLQGVHEQRDLQIINSRQSTAHLRLAAARMCDVGMSVFTALRDKDGLHLFYAGNMDYFEPYTITLGRNITPDFALVRNTRRRLFLLLFAGAGVLLLFTYFVAKSVCFALEKFGIVMQKVQNGDFSVIIPEAGRDEFSFLSIQFNYFTRFLREKEQLTGFLAPGARDSILQSESEVSEEMVTILFCGINNFADFQRLDAEQQLLTLELFLKNIQRVIVDFGGHIDKFTGVAVFGFFRHQDGSYDCLSQVVKACVSLREEVFGINRELNMAGLPELRVGVGVASGNVVLGHVGAQQRKDFTCIGDTVNMAARLETLSKGRVESFVANFDANSFAFCVEKSHFRTGGEVNIKGKTIRQAIYEMSFV